ncbi:LacI family DNA-binding transcriptional regulator [Brachybacterium saurashtrense]|uniref:LacI family transcriptional regulator n=1 Tax=Brachybacterium saurashtrense TaxID=556288 RepID=A0A345YRE9_9MICO|nr:LacI family DNA-binding transcriptional regulator [Brachybacterium saurashtrense]AXK46501.1 LacI family transcriptional regulator [Brachybacterium saurashtrense]RRR24242.1 LacI family transcriptional regulator [Brachybacterium saurashtrense]
MADKRVTIYDVAKEAGVAPSTVSRAFSRPGRVSAATHATVMEAAKRLDYRTAAPAAQEREERHHRLGIEVPDLTNPYFAELVSGMQEAAHEQDFLLLLLDTVEDEIRERSSLESAVNVVDGIVLSGSRLSDATLNHLTKRIPVVVLNRRVAGLDSVTPDFEHGMGQAMTHLAENGIRTVTYVAGPVNSWSDGERWRAARVAARQHGMQVQRHGPFAPTTAGGEQAFEELRDSLPHAVICYNDLVAFGFLISALRAGIKVPGELSVMGHDDIQLSRLVGGGLTTVVSPKRAQGRAAIERLVRRIENPSAHRTPVEGSLPVRLVPRGTTGPRDPGR